MPDIDGAMINNDMAAPTYWTGLVDLSRSLDEIWREMLNRERRKGIRKAQRNEVTVRTADTDGIPWFYEKHLEAAQRIGIPPVPRSLVDDVIGEFGRKGKASLLIAEHAGAAVAALLVVRNALFCHEWQVAAEDDAPSLGQGDVLRWEAMRWAQGLGSKYYDLTGIDEQHLPGIARYKRGFVRELTRCGFGFRRPLGVKLLSRFGRIGGRR